MLLADTGPLVAVANDRDEHHERCQTLLETHRGPVAVPAPVIVEVCQLLAAATRVMVHQAGGERVGPNSCRFSASTSRSAPWSAPPTRESINARIRRAVNARGHFPTEQAALKCVHLAIQDYLDQARITA